MDAVKVKKNIFKKLTQESINEITNRRKAQRELEAQNVSTEAEDTVEKKSCSEKLKNKLIKKKAKNSFDKKPDKEFLTGNNLPDRMRNRFPPELFGVPIEEIDEFHNLEYVIIFFLFARGYCLEFFFYLIVSKR